MKATGKKPMDSPCSSGVETGDPAVFSASDQWEYAQRLDQYLTK
jgi:hypothetical protein